jgi:hypothetical protein
MFGLSSGWYCTHNRAIWIQRIASNSMHESLYYHQPILVEFPLSIISMPTKVQ